MYDYMFAFINDELNSIIPLEGYELMRIEIEFPDVKLIFLSHDKLTVRVMNYEYDEVGWELILKKDYLKPYTGKRKYKEE